MSESIVVPESTSYRRQWAWIPGVLVKPRRTFAQIVPAGRVWLLPLGLLSLTTLARVFMGGAIRQAEAQAGGLTLPPDFQYYPPEMQARIMQSMQATQSPVFFYVFPAILALLGIWLGWMFVSGVLHLALTLLGGRGDTGSTSNVVAWASIPFAIRDLVRFIALLTTRKLIQSPGLAGFVATDATGGMAYIAAALSLVDIYLIWHALLLTVGARAATNLPFAKALTGVLVCILLALAVQALMGFLGGQLTSMTVIRPFY